jgi:hypothetical protein
MNSKANIDIHLRQEKTPDNYLQHPYYIFSTYEVPSHSNPTK